jgi:hypothetical protein
MAADKLDREVREQREALDELMAVEMSLRKKLDRARSERAAYRASAEKLQKDVKTLKAEKDKIDAELATARETALVPTASRKGGVDTDAIIRAAEAAERRHEKEIRGMVMQMEWLKACWDREAKLRSDAAFAKRYLLLEVQIRDAWYVAFSHSVGKQSTNKITATRRTSPSSTVSAPSSSPPPPAAPSWDSSLLSGGSSRPRIRSKNHRGTNSALCCTAYASWFACRSAPSAGRSMTRSDRNWQIVWRGWRGKRGYGGRGISGGRSRVSAGFRAGWLRKGGLLSRSKVGHLFLTGR